MCNKIKKIKSEFVIQNVNNLKHWSTQARDQHTECERIHGWKFRGVQLKIPLDFKINLLTFWVYFVVNMFRKS